MEHQKAQNWPTIGIFLILAVYFLEWASGFLIPITAAFLGFLVVFPASRKLHQWGIPSPVTAAGACLMVGLLVAMVVFTLGGPVTDLVENLPKMISALQYDIGNTGQSTLDSLGQAADAANDMLAGADDNTVVVEVSESGSIAARVAQTAPWLGGQIVLSLALMFFLIASGDMFLQKTVQVIPSFTDKRRAVKIVHDLTHSLGVYLGGITVINLGLGTAIGVAMWTLDVPNPLMFGIIAFSLNFVPFLGAIFGACLAALVDYSASSDLWHAGVVFAAYMGLTSIEGQFVTPYLISGRLKLNPTIVFISVTFFAWIWSVIGMVVAVPLLVMAKLILDQFESTRPIGLFLAE